MNTQKAAASLRKRLPHGAIKKVADEFEMSEGNVRYMLKKLSDHPVIDRLIELANEEDLRKEKLMARMKSISA